MSVLPTVFPSHVCLSKCLSFLVLFRLLSNLFISRYFLSFSLFCAVLFKYILSLSFCVLFVCYFSVSLLLLFFLQSVFFFVLTFCLSRHAWHLVVMVMAEREVEEGRKWFKLKCFSFKVEKVQKDSSEKQTNIFFKRGTKKIRRNKGKINRVPIYNFWCRKI